MTPEELAALLIGPHPHLPGLPKATPEQRNAHVAQFILISAPSRFITSRGAVDRTLLTSQAGGWPGPRVLGDLLFPLTLAEQDEVILRYAELRKNRPQVPGLTFNI